MDTEKTAARGAAGHGPAPCERAKKPEAIRGAAFSRGLIVRVAAILFALMPCSLAVAQLSYKQISTAVIAATPGAAVSAALTAADAAGGVFVNVPAVSSGGQCAIVILGRDYQGYVYATRVTVTCSPASAAVSGLMTIDGIGSGILDYELTEGAFGAGIDLAFNTDETMITRPTVTATPSATATATPTATPT